MMSIEDSINDPFYKNWIKAGLAFKYGKQALQTYVENEIHQFKETVLYHSPTKFCDSCTTANIIPCWTQFVCHGPRSHCRYHVVSDSRKLSRPCPNGVCDKLHNAIVSEHTMMPIWENTDTTQWCNNNWTIAQCFMPKGYSQCKTVEETDFTGILSVVSNATFMSNNLLEPTSNIFLKVCTHNIIFENNFSRQLYLIKLSEKILCMYIYVI